VRVYNLSTGALIHKLTGHTNHVYAVAVTPDGKEIVSGSADKTLKVWTLCGR
jgi:WD40 repeat protein